MWLCIVVRKGDEAVLVVQKRMKKIEQAEVTSQCFNQEHCVVGRSQSEWSHCLLGTVPCLYDCHEPFWAKCLLLSFVSVCLICIG